MRASLRSIKNISTQNFKILFVSLKERSEDFGVIKLEEKNRESFAFSKRVIFCRVLKKCKKSAINNHHINMSTLLFIVIPFYNLVKYFIELFDSHKKYEYIYCYIATLLIR
jgi:hypothetical protein